MVLNSHQIDAFYWKGDHTKYQGYAWSPNKMSTKAIWPPWTVWSRGKVDTHDRTRRLRPAAEHRNITFKATELFVPHNCWKTDISRVNIHTAILFAVDTLTRNSRAPTSRHNKIIHNVLGYFQVIRSQGLIYHSRSKHIGSKVCVEVKFAGYITTKAYNNRNIYHGKFNAHKI